MTSSYTKRKSNFSNAPHEHVKLTPVQLIKMKRLWQPVLLKHYEVCQSIMCPVISAPNHKM